MTVACLCPPRDGAVRHPDGDTVTFKEKLNFHDRVVARKVIELSALGDGGDADILAALTEFYLFNCIAEWTLRDAKGKAVPVSRASISAVMEEHPDEAMELAEKADSLYSDIVLRPLVLRASTSSPPSRTNGSTPHPNGSGRKARTRSSRSSTSTTQTVDTATTRR